MALRVDIDKPTLIKALENSISLLRRNNAKEVNPLMRELREKDILKLQTTIASVTDAK